MSFGEKLQALREKREMSLRSLSRESGLSLGHLQYLEHDAKAPGDETLKRLAKALRIPVADLKAEQITGRVTLLLKEADEIGHLSKEQEAEILEAVRRASGRGGRR